MENLIETKVCSKCGVEKSINHYGKRVDKRGPWVYYRSECNLCKNIAIKLYFKSDNGRKSKLSAQRRSYHKLKYCENNIVIKHERARVYKLTDQYKILQNKRRKREREELNPRYIISLLSKKYDLPHKTIKKYPEFIESYTQQIKLKQLLKSQKNGQESIEAS